MNYNSKINALIDEISQLLDVTDNCNQKRKYIADYLTTNTKELDSDTCDKIEELLAYELCLTGVIHHEKLNKINIIKADITLLDVDVIINPANADGIGCFKIDHKCLDNIIHQKAGPRLRQECMNILNGSKLETGQPLITKSYGLPCSNVCHVVDDICYIAYP